MNSVCLILVSLAAVIIGDFSGVRRLGSLEKGTLLAGGRCLFLPHNRL